MLGWTILLALLLVLALIIMKINDSQEMDEQAQISAFLEASDPNLNPEQEQMLVDNLQNNTERSEEAEQEALDILNENN